MTDEGEIFEDIRALCDEAEDMGLTDVALVLEFALDVFLKETGMRAEPTIANSLDALERSAKRLAMRKAEAPQHVPRVGWSMSTFPLADMISKAS